MRGPIVGAYFTAAGFVRGLYCVRHLSAPCPVSQTIVLCRLAGIFPDELRHAHDAFLDGLVRSCIAETDVLPFVRYARTKMDVGKHGNAGFVEQAFAEFLRIRRADE